MIYCDVKRARNVFAGREVGEREIERADRDQRRKKRGEDLISGPTSDDDEVEK